MSSKGLNNVLLDDIDLQTGVKDSWDLGAAVDKNVDFL